MDARHLGPMSATRIKRPVLIALGVLAILASASYLVFNGRSNDLATELATPPSNDIRNEALRERIQNRYLQATRGFPSVEALSKLAQLYHANGYLNRAKQSYELLLERDEISSKDLHRLARILSTYGMQDQAIQAYRQVLADSPQYTPARIHLGNALLKSRRNSEAEVEFRAAIETDSRSAHALLGLARLRIDRDQWTEARKILEAATLISNYRIGADLLATVYETLGENEEAISLRRDRDFGAYRDLHDPWVEELLDDCYDTFRLATAAGMASFREDFDKANELIGRAIELDPADPMLHFQSGGISQAAGEIASALDHYRKSVQLKPDFSDGWHYMYQIHRDAGNAIEANRILDDGFHACPDSPALLLEMSERMRQQSRIDQAIVFVQKAIELRPHEAQAYLTLARLHLMTNRVDAAISAFENALRVEPGNSMALSTLTLNAINTRNQEAADRYFKRLRKQPQMDPQSVDQLSAQYETQFGSQP